jgi:hypothetical protein
VHVLAMPVAIPPNIHGYACLTGGEAALDIFQTGFSAIQATPGSPYEIKPVDASWCSQRQGPTTQSGPLQDYVANDHLRGKPSAFFIWETQSRMDDGGDSGTSQSPQPEKKKLTRNARA